MRVLHLASVDEYLARLRRGQDETRAFFRELLIGVTAFFRDPDAFESLAIAAIRDLLERAEDEPVRIWVPGCSSGEEAYSIAILVREEMERCNRIPEVQIFATDIDGHALEVARRGAYPTGVAIEVNPERLERYLSSVDSATTSQGSSESAT
jgi:chemotaxis methyl-accepting protein methylase